MLKITYTNGDTQCIKVTGDFFAVTLAPKNGKPSKITPTEKAETLAFDLADDTGREVSSISIVYPGGDQPKVKLFKPVHEIEIEEKTEDTPSFIKELKLMKKAGKLQWKEKKYQSWKWLF